MSRVQDHGCGAATREGGQDWGLADVDRGYLELLKHKLCQLQSQIFVVNGALSKDERGIPRVNHQLIYQPFPQDILQVIKVNYTSR